MLLLQIIEIKNECVTVSSSLITYVPRFMKVGHLVQKPKSGHTPRYMLPMLWIQDNILV
jgi:hypothetical protein